MTAASPQQPALSSSTSGEAWARIGVVTEAIANQDAGVGVRGSSITDEEIPPLLQGC
jgi:hypothetical protein